MDNYNDALNDFEETMDDTRISVDDVVTCFDQLQAEYNELTEQQQASVKDKYDAIAKFADTLDDYSGSQLIHDDEWLTYATEVVDKILESDEELQNVMTTWPYTCFTMDYEKAARDLSSDYTCVDYLLSSYYIV